MNLRQLQKYIKLSVLIGFVGVYGLAAFSLGKITTGLSGEVKGETFEDAAVEELQRPLPYADVQSSQIIASSVKFCSNSNLGFQIAYPSGWFTTHNSDEQKCLYFAPYSFIVPEFTTSDFAPVEIELIDPITWQDTITFYENPNDFFNVFSSENLEYDGKLVKKIVSKSTGEGNSPRGFLTVHFLLFDGEKPLHLSYGQLDEDENTDEMQLILEEIARSVKYL